MVYLHYTTVYCACLCCALCLLFSLKRSWMATLLGKSYTCTSYTVLDITLIAVGPQLYCFAICLYIYSRYNTDWIANTEIGLDPSNSVIKRLRCSHSALPVCCWKNVLLCLMYFLSHLVSIYVGTLNSWSLYSYFNTLDHQSL